MAAPSSSAASGASLDRADHIRQCTVKDKHYTITAETTIYKSEDFTCCIDYETDLYIQQGKDTRQLLGEVVGTTLDKTIRPTRSGRGPPSWVKTVLHRPTDYTGDLRVHATSKEQLNDTHKLFQLLFDRDTLKPNVEFDEDFGHLLSSEKLHFIAHFCLEPEFRGKGLAKEAMLTYLDGIDRMDNEWRYQGAVILSPAPVRDETDKKEKAGDKVKSYMETVRDLMVSYSKAGYESLFDEFKDLHGGIVVMIRTTSQVAMDEDGDVEMTDVDDGGSRAGSVTSSGHSARSDELSIAVSPLKINKERFVQDTSTGQEAEEAAQREEVEEEEETTSLADEAAVVDSESARGESEPVSVMQSTPLPSDQTHSTRKTKRRSTRATPAPRQSRELANLQEHIRDPDPATQVLDREYYATYRWRGRWYLLEEDTPRSWTAGCLLRIFREGKIWWQGNEQDVDWG